MVDSTDCNYQLNGNQGCVTVDPNPSSYGQAFADAGGGIFVTEYSESGVSYVPKAVAITANMANRKLQNLVLQSFIHSFESLRLQRKQL